MARKKKDYTLDEVTKALSRKHDVKIDVNKGIIEILHNGANFKSNDLGNSSWGKIDYLIKHHRFMLIKVEEFTRDKK